MKASNKTSLINCVDCERREMRPCRIGAAPLCDVHVGGYRARFSAYGKLASLRAHLPRSAHRRAMSLASRAMRDFPPLPRDAP
jgi:hypothetical protein